MLNVLSIGNSFSQDAQNYLHQVARAEGESLFCVNLYIGGCSLERHFRNVMGDSRAYEIQVCGKASGFYTSVKEALLSRSWDVVTIQQASHLSTDFSSYVPYLDEIAAVVRKYAPRAKLYVHQTWGYESDTERIRNHGFESMREMSERVFEAYDKARAQIGADGMIPAGRAMLALAEAGHAPAHRDTFHASLGAGRYLLACVWYETLTGKPVTNEAFSDFDVAVSQETAAHVREIAHKTIKEFSELEGK
ncbi:MAG: DUF4886 domain-containing protein [Clostridia bacterium]|nr:DUF4886 domain-containing protein [Clostridia bacterium]